MTSYQMIAFQVFGIGNRLQVVAMISSDCKRIAQVAGRKAKRLFGPKSLSNRLVKMIIISLICNNSLYIWGLDSTGSQLVVLCLYSCLKVRLQSACSFWMSFYNLWLSHWNFDLNFCVNNLIPFNLSISSCKITTPDPTTRFQHLTHFIDHTRLLFTNSAAALKLTAQHPYQQQPHWNPAHF